MLQQKTVFLLVALLLSLQSTVRAFHGCGYFPSDRPQLGGPLQQCPYFVNTNITVENQTIIISVNATPTSVTTFLTRITGSIGWCNSYIYPVVESATRSFGNDKSALFITMAFPWCAQALIFTGRTKVRTDNWQPLPLTYAVRPLGYPNRSGFTCGSAYNAATNLPRNFSMWDVGDGFRAPVTLNLDDRYNIFLAHPLTDMVQHIILANNANVSSTNTSLLPNSNGTIVWWSSTQPCGNITGSQFFGSPPEICDVCKSDCIRSPFDIQCLSPNRTRPLDRSRALVSLACRDPFWGYLWRIDHPSGALPMHFDWETRRLIEQTRVKLFTTPERQLVTFFDADIFLPQFGSQVPRMPYLDISLEGIVNPFGAARALFDMPLWPNATMKHTACSNCLFYIPSFVDTPPAFGPGGNPASEALGVHRPSHLWLYAGAPDHYKGSTTLGAFVEFFDVEDLFNMSTLRALGILNATAIAEQATFVADETRLSVMDICKSPIKRVASSVHIANGTVNMTTFCASLFNTAGFDGFSTTTWPQFLTALFQTFFPNITVIDPMPVCTCDQVRCALGDEQAIHTPNVLYDYSNLPPQAPVNVSVQPVCRYVTLQNLTNLPPPPAMNNTPGHYVVEVNMLLSIRNKLLPPYEVTTIQPDTFTNYSDAIFGVIWRIDNKDPDPTHAGYSIRWEVGEYIPPDGLTGGQVIPVPFSFTSATNTFLASVSTRWIFSRTFNSHKLYGNARVSCPVGGEASCTPQDPPLPTWGPSRTIFAKLTAAQVAALPECACYVHIPCNNSIYLFQTNRTVNVSALAGPAPPPPPPPTPIAPVPILPGCIPYPEICNLLDDNCDGKVDNAPGVNQTCQSVFAGGPCLASPGVLTCDYSTVPGTLVCFGQVLPTAEKCDQVDHDCDNIACNPPGLGLPCGSDVGRCQKGTLICPSCNVTNQEPVCQGSIDPLPAEICGNSIDDDCNGLVDDGCQGQGVPPPAPQPTPAPEPTTPLPPVTPTPTGNVTTPTPSPDLPTLWSLLRDLLLQLLDDLSLDQITYNFTALIFVMILLCVIFVTCVVTQMRNSVFWTYRYPAYDRPGGGGEEEPEAEGEEGATNNGKATRHNKRRRRRGGGEDEPLKEIKTD
jgi:hypothetical protein